MNRVVRAHCWRRHNQVERTGRVDRVARWGGEPPIGRPGGREGEERMEIKIIINEAGAGRGERRMGPAGRRMHRGSWMGGERAGHGHGHHGGEMPSERGRVIGKVVEMPDGRVKIIGRGGPEMTHNSRRHGGEERQDEERRESRFSRRHFQGHHDGGRHGAPDAGDEGREARRARRRLAREIVRALEESGFGEFGKA